VVKNQCDGSEQHPERRPSRRRVHLDSQLDWRGGKKRKGVNCHASVSFAVRSKTGEEIFDPLKSYIQGEREKGGRASLCISSRT